jgi:hypothetical protein
MKIKKIPLIILYLMLGSWGLYFLIDYLIYSDQEKILDILELCKNGIQSEDPEPAFEYVSPNYTDIYGLSKEKLLEIAENVFSKFDDFKVLIEKTRLSLESDKAELSLSFRIMITYNGQRTFLFGDLNKPAHVILIFERTKENKIGWLITGMKNLETRWPLPVPHK